MEAYRIQVFLHIVAVVVAFGITFAFPFMIAFAEKNGVAATRFALKFTDRVDKMVVTPGTVIVGLLGVGLIFDDNTGYKDDFPVWLVVAIVWYVGAVGVSQTIMRSNTRASIRALEGVPDDAELPAAYRALAKQASIIGGLLGLSVVGITFMMVWGSRGGF